MDIIKDPIKEVLKEIQSDQEVCKTQFSKSFLNDAAEVVEVHGLGGAELYAMDREDREEMKHQAKSLLTVLHILQKQKHAAVARNRVVCRYIVKTLDVITKEGKKDE